MDRDKTSITLDEFRAAFRGCYPEITDDELDALMAYLLLRVVMSRLGIDVPPHRDV